MAPGQQSCLYWGFLCMGCMQVHKLGGGCSAQGHLGTVPYMHAGTDKTVESGACLPIHDLPTPLQGDSKSPQEWIKEAEPILVEGPVVASYGSELTHALLPPEPSPVSIACVSV